MSLASGAAFGGTTAITDAASVATFDPGQEVSLWATRFNDGVVLQAGDPISVGRPDPAAGGTALNQVPPPQDTNQFQVGYHSRFSPFDATELAPPLDGRGFRVAHLDGIFPGNYVDRDLRDQATGVVSPPNAPDLTQNRILALHRARSIREAHDNAEFLASPFWQTTADSRTHHMIELFANDEATSGTGGRLWPETAAFAAHDLLIGLAEHDGVGLYNPAYIDVPSAPDGGSWLGMSGTNLQFFSGTHPGWAGYEAVLKLLKTELREFLVAGERDFDLGFEVTNPSDALDQIVLSSDYGWRTGWVGIAEYPRLGHTILRIRNRVVLIVTHSEASEEATEFSFCDAARFPNATAVQVLSLSPSSVSAQTGPYRFMDSLSGIEARVYRIDLG